MSSLSEPFKPSGGVDLLVVHPWSSRGAYGPLEYLAAVEPPLWARLIAGHVRDQGFTVRICDAEAMQKPPHLVAVEAFALSPRLVCLCAYGHQPSASTQSMDEIYEIAKQVRSVTTAKIVVVGGHVSALPETTLRECEAIDCVIVGEGPNEIEDLLKGENAVSGLATRGADGRIYVNPRGPLIGNLQFLHGDTWDMLPMKKYRAHNWQCLGEPEMRAPYASIYTSLGCPYGCEFCCINAPFGQRTYRMRSPASVAEEVSYLNAKYGVRTLKIIDEMFVLKPSHYVDICERLAVMNLHLNIWAYARVDTVREQYLNALRRAGVQWLALGIESASPHVRDSAEKHLRCDDIVDLVKRIQQHGINVIANYIFGLPSDDMDSMQATAELSRQVPSDWANFYCATAYPGSPLYDRALLEKWSLPDTWGNYAQHAYGFQPLPTARGVQPAEVLAIRDEAHCTFFAQTEFLDRTEKKFGSSAVAHVLSTQMTHIPRRLLEECAA